MAIAALIALGFVLQPAAASAASGTSLNVYVGYADSSRSTPGTFPTPWDEPSNSQIIFDGCHPSSSCQYDGGAVRLVNNSGSTLTINSVKVEYSSACVYDIWPRNTTLAPGSQLIVDQLTSTATQTDKGCTNTTSASAPNYGIVDGSDIGPNGVNWDQNCTQSGVIPQVDVQVNGSTTTFADKGQVLNTGGVDSAYCPSGGPKNESIQWTAIGSVPCLGAALTLGPSSQSDVRGATATVTAHLADACGNPLQGSVVGFRVLGTNAPDAGQVGSAVTDSQGNANFTYPNVHSDLGTDDVQADVSGPGGTLVSNVATVNWVKGPTTGPSGGSTGPGGGAVPIGVITGLSMHPTSMRPAPSGPSVVSAAASRRFGTVLRYRDSQAALTTFEVLKSVPGRLQGKSCVAPVKAHRRRGKPCTRFVSMGSFNHSDVAGGNGFRFTGRVHGHRLAPGGYLLEVIPHDPGGAGPMRTKAFRII